MSGRYSKRPAFDPNATPYPANDNFPTKVYDFPDKPARPRNPRPFNPRVPFPKVPRPPLPRIPRIPLPGPWRWVPYIPDFWPTKDPSGDGAARSPNSWPLGRGLPPHAQLKCLASPEYAPPDYVQVTHGRWQNGHVLANSCGIGGQAISGGGWRQRGAPDYVEGDEIGARYQPSSNYRETITIWEFFEPFRHFPPSSWRFRLHSVYWISWTTNDIVAGPRVEPRPYVWPQPDPAIYPTADPNITRGVPPDTIPPPEPINPFSPPTVEVAPPIVPTAITISPVGDPTPAVFPTRKEPPGPREKEQKGLTKFAAGVFAIVDAASEYAEVVDAFFGALPDDVQKRWERNSRGFIDQAGQYGIDGADWKLNALYHNWHRLDLNKVVENLIHNFVEDRLIGGLNRNLPVNSGVLAEPGNKAIAELLNQFFGD